MKCKCNNPMLPITLQSNPFFKRYRCSLCGHERTTKKPLPKDPEKLKRMVGGYLMEMGR